MITFDTCGRHFCHVSSIIPRNPLEKFHFQGTGNSWQSLLFCTCDSNRHHPGSTFLNYSISSPQDREKPGGRLQTIANFFQNLGSSRSSASTTQSGLRTPSEKSSPDGDASLRTISSQSVPSPGRRLVSSSADSSPSSAQTNMRNLTQLPPILTESKGRLTVDTKNPESIITDPMNPVFNQSNNGPKNFTARLMSMQQFR